MSPRPLTTTLLALLFLVPGCRSTPDAPPLSDDPALNAFAEQVGADLEAHAWQALIDAAEPAHYRTQVVEHGMPEPQYVAELLGLHHVDNDISRGERVEWSDLERIESVELDALSTTGPRSTLTGAVRLRDGSTLELRASIVRSDGGHALTGGVG